MKRHSLSVALLSALVLAPTSAAQQGPEPDEFGMISFGDSLCDVGNVAGVTEPGNSPVIRGYYRLTHYSDGPVWVDYVAGSLGLPDRAPGRGDTTTQDPRPRGNVWAWGGAEASDGTVQPAGVTEPIPNLLTSVANFLEARTPDRFTLYTVWSGADNLLIGGAFGPRAALFAVDAVIDTLRELEAAGARRFVVVNLPKLGDTPAAQSGSIVDEAAANFYARTYNRLLGARIEALKIDPTFRGRIVLIDSYTVLEEIVDTVENGSGTYVPPFPVPGGPVAITNVRDEALTVFQATGTFPSGYLFWDDVHPTTQGHQIVAGLVLQELGRDAALGGDGHPTLLSASAAADG